MDRRDFLKASMCGVVVSATGCASDRFKEDKARRSSVRLEADGWLRRPAMEIPVIAEADVVVLGGGPAGVAAAVNAARTGVKAIILERYNFLGGLWTGGLVLPMLSTHGMAPDKQCPNLLVAGRCFGFEKELAYDAREIGTCLVTGQAAGVASALAALSRTSVQDVDIKQLQSHLLHQKARLG